MKTDPSKIEKNAKISLFILILNSFVFILVSVLSVRIHEKNGIEDAMALAIPGLILAIGGSIASLVFAFKALRKIKNSEEDLKGKKLVYVVIAINVLWLVTMFA